MRIISDAENAAGKIAMAFSDFKINSTASSNDILFKANNLVKIAMDMQYNDGGQIHDGDIPTATEVNDGTTTSSNDVSQTITVNTSDSLDSWSSSIWL